MRPIRVAHLIYSKKVGGSEMVAANVCGKLERPRFAPIVLFMVRSSGPMPQIIKKSDVPVHGLNMFWRRLPFESYYFSHILNKLEIDILHIHHVPLYLRIATGVKHSRVKGVVLTEHARRSIELSLTFQEGCRQAIGEVNYFTTVSADLKEYFVKCLGMPARDIVVIPNGVDVQRFCPGPKNTRLRAMLPPDFDGKILIHVGRFTAAKDHQTLLLALKKAIRQGSKLFLFLVGEGELQKKIENIISDLGLLRYVKMLGLRDDVDELLKGADMFVLSSCREGVPMVLMEAMACGLPVVTTSVGGILEVAANYDNALLVESGKPDLFAQAIISLVRDPDLEAHISRNARKLIKEKYSLESVAENYSKLYYNVMFNTC